MAALVSALLVPVLAGLLLALAVLFGLRRVALAVMLVRPSCDLVFSWVKDALDQSTGPGGAINVLVIGLGLISLVHAPHLVLSPTLLAWGVFLLAAIASLLHGPDPAGGMRLLLTLTTYAAAFSLPFAIVRDRETAAQCLWIALLSSLAPAAWAVVELATTPDTLFGKGRLQSTFGHPNIFAFFIVSNIALILFLTRSTLVRLAPARRRMLYAYIMALLLLLLFTYGLDLFQSYLPLFFPQGTHESGVGVHNTFLQLYFEMGLIGLAAFLAIFVALFVQLRRGLAHDRDGAIVMATLCVSYFPLCYSDNLLDYLNFQWFFWFVLGTVLAWMRLWPRSPTT